MKVINLENITYLIGENAKDNWYILTRTDIIKETDIFFHLSKFPSCYVILVNQSNETIDMKHIIYGAKLCKANTKYKNQNLYVDYTTCDNVIKGENIGEIVYKRNKKVKKIKL